jgi:hypothetical protein
VRSPIEPGYMAPWKNRRKLAAAKLGAKLTPSTTAGDFQSILLTATEDKVGDDFVEVHIHGSLTARSFQSYCITDDAIREDKARVDRVRTALAKLGVPERC